MVSWRQGKRISKAAGSRSLHGCLDLDGSSDQLSLVDSWAVEVTRSALQKRLWPVGWWGLKIWEPTSGLLLPPSPAGAPSSPVGTLSQPQSMTPPTPSEHAHTACPGTVTKGPTLVVTKRCPFTICFPPLILSICVWLLSSVLFTHKHDSIPTLQVN